MAKKAQHAVDVLRNKALSDFQRPNLFEVEIIFKEESMKSEKTSELLTYEMIQSISIPSTSIQNTEIKRMGRRIFVPGEINNSPEVNLSVYSDVEGKCKKFFSAWQSAYYNSMNSTSKEHIGKYSESADVRIYTLDSYHRRRTVTACINAWPRMIGELSMSNDTENALSTFSVALVFDYSEFVGGKI